MSAKVKRRSKRRRASLQREASRWLRRPARAADWLDEVPRRSLPGYSWFLITVVVTALGVISFGWLTS